MGFWLFLRSWPRLYFLVIGACSCELSTTGHYFFTLFFTHKHADTKSSSIIGSIFVSHLSFSLSLPLRHRVSQKSGHKSFRTRNFKFSFNFFNILRAASNICVKKQKWYVSQSRLRSRNFHFFVGLSLSLFSSLLWKVIGQ